MGNESGWVLWHSHWGCQIDAGCWWQTRKGLGRHLQKGSGGIWEAASWSEFAANGHFWVTHIVKGYLMWKRNWSLECEGLGFIHSHRWGRTGPEFPGLVQVHMVSWCPTCHAPFCHPVHTCGHIHVLTLALLLKGTCKYLYPKLWSGSLGISFCCLRKIEFLYMLLPNTSYFNALFDAFPLCFFLPLYIFLSSLFCLILSFPLPFLFLLTMSFFSLLLTVPITSIQEPRKSYLVSLSVDDWQEKGKTRVCFSPSRHLLTTYHKLDLED